METLIASILEPKEKIVILNNGIWGQRAGIMADLYGGITKNICFHYYKCNPLID